MHYEEYNSFGPKPDQDYNPISLKVNTKICNHKSCQPQAEYEYALILAFAKGEITREQWVESRPPYKTHYYGIDNSNRKPWCYGSMLKKRPLDVPGADVVREPLSPTLGFHVDPDSLKPYTEWCKHEDEDACLNSSAALLSLYVLTARSIVQREVLQNIRNLGWSKRLDEEVRCGRDPNKYVYLNIPVSGNPLLWNPQDATDWTEKDLESYNRDLEEATAKELVYLEDFNRIKCNYREINDGLYVYLRKKKGFVTFEMKEIPEVIEKLAKMWAVTGGGSELLHNVAEKTTALSIQYKKRKHAKPE
jgi:hypothetical protein